MTPQRRRSATFSIGLSSLALGSALFLAPRPAPANNPIFVVTATAWNDPAGLKAAVAFANANPGTHINFTIPLTDPGFVTDPKGNYFHIVAGDPTQSLLITAEGTFVDGTTQTQFTGDTNLKGPEIFLDGVNVWTGGYGFQVAAQTAYFRGMTISAFREGIHFGPGGDNGTVLGCYLGTDPWGLSTIGNVDAGVGLDGVHGCNIGSPVIESNLMAGANDGVWLYGGAYFNSIYNNLIGINGGGTIMGNYVNGIRIDTGAADNVVSGNVVAGSFGSGMLVYWNAGTGNNFFGNYVRNNGCMALRLQKTINEACMLDPNDALDADSGPNDMQNYPVLSSAVSLSRGGTLISGVLDSLPNSQFTIEFGTNSTPNSAGFVEPHSILGTLAVTTNSVGHAVISYTAGTLAKGQWVTASATNVGAIYSETGPFSPGVKVN